MNLIAGLSGLKTAADLTRTLRDGLKAGTIKADDIAGRIGEIYDYIIDSKDALVDAKDELETLKAELLRVTDERELARSMDFDGKVYWLPKDDKWQGPFCPICWDIDRKLVRLDHQRVEYQNPLDASFYCHAHRLDFSTRKRSNIAAPQPPLSRILP